ncbi:fibronectin type III domain-containing protein [Nakamurella flava]|uniref:fibronectin type III domain-containing protein n=1 Tax=Nakamurella flava TaxID=2576308 RepID=UPI00140816E1|nr:fibronectin type III domain-containing protein [Nakamurella flava]
MLVTLLVLPPSAGAAETSSLPLVTATPAPGQLTATWTASLFPDGSEVSGYTVSVVGTGYAETVRFPSGRDRTITFVALPAGDYRVLVQPGINGGVGPTGFTDYIEVPWLPGRPTDVQASSDKTGVTVRWQAPSSDGRRDISGYVVTPQTAAGSAPAVTTGGDARSALLTGLTPGTSYTFTVAARNAIGQGLPSDPSAAVLVVSPLVVSLATPLGRVGWDYHGRTDVTLGTAPYRFAVVGGGLPAGLGLDPDTGAITGRPQAIGTSSVTIGVTDAAGTTQSATTSVKVAGPVVAGDLLITSMRQSGPAGPGDEFVDITNVSPTPIPTAGLDVETGAGATVTLADDAPVLAPSGHLLIVGPTWSGATAATKVAQDGLGTDGLRIRFPDGSGTVSDAVGPQAGLHTGRGLPALTGEPAVDFAWMRSRTPAGPVSTGNNSSDFQLISADGGAVGGRAAVRGTVTPVAVTATRSTTVTSLLLDPTVPASAAPNREITTVDGQRFLTIRRWISNPGTAPAAPGLALRISTMSIRNGGGSPFSLVPADRRAELTVATPSTRSSSVRLANGSPVTVSNLAPAGGGTGGLFAVLPLGTYQNTLFSGQRQAVAITFSVDRPGAFWVSWDVLTGVN